MTAPTPFLVPPNGAQPRIERLTRLTSLQVAKNGTEHRRVLSAFPRLTFGASYTLLSHNPESTLFPVRAGVKLLVPNWAHRVDVSGGQIVLDAGFEAGSSVRIAVLRSTGVVEQRTVAIPALGQAVSAIPGDVAAAPLIECYLSGDSFDVEYATPTVRVASLSFDALVHRENPGPWTSPLFPQRPDWQSSVIENNSFSLNRFDAGHLWSQELRYGKRAIRVSVKLMGRQAVLDFRRFIYALQGRAEAFLWQAPMDSNQRSWRLADDAVELQYIKPKLATSTLSFVELS
jgi:hypothetical protein